MPRLLALVCLLAALATVGLASPGRVNPGMVDDQSKDPEKAIPPTVLSPQPGDHVGSSVIVSGTSSCKPVMLTWTPPGTTVEVPVGPAPDNAWTYTITGVTGDITVDVCCKKASPPHGPCAGPTQVKYDSTIGVTVATPFAAPGVKPAAAPAIPEFPRGRIALTGPFVYDQNALQSVYVFLENAHMTDPKCHRSQTAIAELNTAQQPTEWRACFANVGPGLYLVRWIVVSRGAAPVPGSYVIKVR